MVEAIVIVQQAAGGESERELTFLVSPRVGETILVPGLGLTSGFKAVVSEIIHQPATRDDQPKLYLILQPEAQY